VVIELSHPSIASIRRQAKPVRTDVRRIGIRDMDRWRRKDRKAQMLAVIRRPVTVKVIIAAWLKNTIPFMNEIAPGLLFRRR